MKKQVSRLAKSAASNIFSCLVSFGYTGERLIPGLRWKDRILRALLLAEKSFWPHKVVSGEKSTAARWKLMLISDQAKDLVKAEAPCLLFNRWFTSGILNKSTVWVEKSSMRRFMWRKREFFGVIWRCFARVKCGNIMSGFYCRESHLLYDLLKALTDKTQVCGWARVTRILCAKHKNASWVFSLGDFVLESLFCIQKLWSLNLFSADTQLWASWFDWLKGYYF